MSTPEEKIAGLEQEQSRLRGLNSGLKEQLATAVAGHAQLTAAHAGLKTEHAALTTKAAAFGSLGEQLASAQGASAKVQADFDAFRSRAGQEALLGKAGMWDADGVNVMLSRFERSEGTDFGAFVTEQAVTPFFKAMATAAPVAPNGAGVADLTVVAPEGGVPVVVAPAAPVVPGQLGAPVVPVAPEVKPGTPNTQAGTSPGPNGGAYQTGQALTAIGADPVGFAAQHGLKIHNPERVKSAMAGN